MTCPDCERYKKSAAMWRNKAYEASGHPLPWKPDELWQGLTDEEIEMACWARVDKDLNVTHLDMDLCRKGPQNEYTALAIAIWDAAKKDWQGLTKDEVDGWELPDRPTVFEFAKFIEAKIKEKNG